MNLKSCLRSLMTCERKKMSQTFKAETLRTIELYDVVMIKKESSMNDCVLLLVNSSL